MEERINGEKGIWLGLFAYISLSILKMLIGSISHSSALFADGLNNSTDILASIAVLIGLKVSKKPADHDHAYGHTRAEMIAALIAAFIMFAVGIQVISQAIIHIFQTEQVKPDVMAAWVAAFGAGVMLLVYLYNRNLAKKLNSQAIMAAAKDNLSDAWVSMGTIIGVIVTQFGLYWLDPLVALLIGGIIIHTAWGIFREATHTLTDGFDQEKLVLYTETILQVPGVQSISDIKARSHGNEVYLDVVIIVDADLSLIDSHQISDEIEYKMKADHQINNIIIHVEPDPNYVINHSICR